MLRHEPSGSQLYGVVPALPSLCGWSWRIGTEVYDDRDTISRNLTTTLLLSFGLMMTARG